MPSQESLIALFAALPLVVVVTILIGNALPNGAITITSGAAVIAFTTFFLTGGYGVADHPSSSSVTTPLAWVSAIILLLAAWTLASADAARAHYWGWLALLSVTAYLSFWAILTITAQPAPCLITPSAIGPIVVSCVAPSASLQLLVRVGCFIAPLAAQLYSLRDTLPRSRRRPDGLTISPLSAPDELAESREKL